MSDSASAPSKAVLMCGGLGTRLRPWSYVIPKPLFPIGERPILELLLERLKLSGVSEILLSVGYKAEMIEWQLRDGSHLGLKLHYVHESEPLGTAGALNLMRDHLTAPFLMMNGDLVTHLDFAKMYAFHQDREAVITVAAKDYDIQVPYGVIDDQDGIVTRLREKPTQRLYINSGIYVISPQALDLLPSSGRFDATQLIQAAMDADLRVCSYHLSEYWMDIGRIEDYQRANEDAERDARQSDSK
ncbi:MAG: NTP transferase domain-containing protein [Anaerolineae bacterium]|nr:NTP transferase domain-containing protein [Anaerolineae bacterium]